MKVLKLLLHCLKPRKPSRNCYVGVLFILTTILFVKRLLYNQDYEHTSKEKRWLSAGLFGHAKSCQCNDEEETRSAEDSQEPIRILSWTAKNMKVEGQKEDWFPEGFSSCRKYYPASWTPCVYTNDRSQLKVSDVIMFRARRTEVDDMPDYRSKRQKWVFYEFEPPFKVWMYTNLTLIKDQFNITSTYSRDSDVFKNGYIKKCYYDSTKTRRVGRKPQNYAAKKNGIVAWFVSVCKSQSMRENYVKRLQKFIPVDVYGACGPFKCGSAHLPSWKVDQCEKRLLHDNGSYKFYLSLENSLCDDYITEKLWKLGHFEVVPIVMGGIDYANMLPPGSYIDVRDFDSPKSLADYLLYLDSNDDEYNKLIENRLKLKCYPVESTIPWHCRFCQYLQVNREKKQVVHDVARFWGARRCQKPKEFFSFMTDDSFW